MMALCLAATATYAQSQDTAGTPADSLRMDSIIHALPEVMV